MDQGTLFEGTVSHLSSQGYGVVSVGNDQKAFVRGVWPGDHGLFRINDECEDRYRFAELVELRRAAPDRITPPCPHSGLAEQSCGGCPWMIASYPSQLQQKQYRVRYALSRAGFDEIPMADIWPSPKIFAYRSRAQFKTDGDRIGYAAKQGRGIVPIESCPVLSVPLERIYKRIRESLPRDDFRPSGDHIWSFLDLDEESDPSQLVLNRRRAFSQANKSQNEAMRQWIRVHLAPRPQEVTVLELFAGSGNFTEVLVELGYPHILALEVAPSAVDVLQQKAWPTVDARREDLYNPRFVRKLFYLARGIRSVLVNPPRAGLQGLARCLARDLPELDRILYVSCDVQTLANDLRTLRLGGFELQMVQALDQMPHTPHTEILCTLVRRSPRLATFEL